MSDDVQARLAEMWNTMDASWESYGKILEDKTAMNAGRVAVITPHEHITYDQLDARVNRVGNALKAMGVAKNDKVCVMLPNIPEFLYAWWGNAKLGGVTVPLNTALKGEGLAYIINHSDAETIILTTVSGGPGEIHASLSQLRRIIVLALRANAPPSTHRGHRLGEL
jgi:crotonobetaine/carnitine-CoA ligase